MSFVLMGFILILCVLTVLCLETKRMYVHQANFNGQKYVVPFDRSKLLWLTASCTLMRGCVQSTIKYVADRSILAMCWSKIAMSPYVLVSNTK